MGIKEALGAVCVAVLLSEMLLLLVPSGGMKRFARFVIGIMLAAALIAPLAQALPQVDVKDTQVRAEQDISYADVIWNVYKREAQNIDDRSRNE